MNGTLLSNEGRAATKVTDDVNAVAGQRGVMLALDITKAPNTAETLTLVLEAKDPSSGKYVPITVFKASKKGEELGAGTTLLFTVYPGALETEAVGSHEVMALPLPRKFRVKITHSAGSEWKYSLGASPLA